MTKIFFVLYYSFLSYIILLWGPFFVNENTGFISEFRGFAKILEPWKDSDLLYPAVFIFTTLFLGWSILFHNRLLRVFVAFLVLLIFFMRYSFGIVLHGTHTWIISCIWMCFISEKKSISSTHNLTVIRLIQATILSHYFFAGLWKFLKLFKVSSWEMYHSHLLDQIAYSFLTVSNGPKLTIIQRLSDLPIFPAGFLLIVVFQLSSLLPVLFNKGFIFYGLAVVGFHIVTGIALGIWFSSTILSVLFFLIVAEFLLKHERENPS